MSTGHAALAPERPPACACAVPVRSVRHMERRSLVPAAGVGALAGLAGGAVVMGLSVLFMLARGGDPWQALKLASYPFTGSDAFVVGFDPDTVILGLLCHHG